MWGLFVLMWGGLFWGLPPPSILYKNFCGRPRERALEASEEFEVHLLPGEV